MSARTNPINNAGRGQLKYLNAMPMQPIANNNAKSFKLRVACSAAKHTTIIINGARKPYGIVVSRAT